MRIVIASLLVCALHVAALAQSGAAVQKEEIKKLGFLLGNWKGEGWVMTQDGKRRQFSQTEEIQSKLDGIAILVEGTGRTRREETGEEFVAFRALAVLSYDEQAKKYRFVTQTNDGRFAQAEAKLIDGGLEWWIQPPSGGRVRYTIKITDKGEWHEVGEYSMDEKNWRKFHEMTLRRTS